MAPNFFYGGPLLVRPAAAVAADETLFLDEIEEKVAGENRVAVEVEPILA